MWPTIPITSTKKDVQLLKNLGVSTYRMSISWSRVFPTGKGEVNQKGLDYYNRVVDELLANNITPYITMFHWDTPAGLAGRLAVARYVEGICGLLRVCDEASWRSREALDDHE